MAVIGGGITGLTAAYFLQETAREQGRPLSVSLLEASDRLGGKILTERVDGFCIEAGPDSFLARKPWARQLAERLGLGQELVPTDPRHRRTYILHGGRLHPIPEGLFMFVPVDLGAFLRTRLFSPLGKARMALEPFIPKGPAGDETIARFVTRRAGREALERLAEPLLTGIYSGRADRLGIMSTFPQLKEMEQRTGSLVKSFLAGRSGGAAGGARPGAKASGTGAGPKAGAAGPGANGAAGGGGANAGAGDSAFLALRGGLATLVETLTQRLDGVSVRTGIRVTEIAAHPAGQPFAPGAGHIGETALAPAIYSLTLSDGTRFQADAVIVAVPAYVAAQLIGPICPEAVPHLQAIRFVSTITCVLGFDRASVQHPLDGSGFLVPRREGRCITACTWVSSKWAHAAKPDQALIRCYLGRDGEQEALGWSDEEVAVAVRRELKELMGITAEPRLARVYRWERAMPQYEVGHRERVAAIEGSLARHPGLILAGASYHGVGVPDCIRQGQDAAERILSYVFGKGRQHPGVE